MTISNSTFFANTVSLFGGGIWNSGELAVSSSTFTNNIALIGGGIINGGQMTISNSTMSSNSAVQQWQSRFSAFYAISVWRPP